MEASFDTASRRIGGAQPPRIVPIAGATAESASVPGPCDPLLQELETPRELLKIEVMPLVGTSKTVRSTMERAEGSRARAMAELTKTIREIANRILPWSSAAKKEILHLTTPGTCSAAQAHKRRESEPHANRSIIGRVAARVSRAVYSRKTKIYTRYDDVVLDDREVSENLYARPARRSERNKSDAVELRFNVLASSLPPVVKERLIKLAGARVTADSVLLIDSRESRTQAQNRLAARGRLIELIKQALVRPRKRRKTKPGPAAREKRLTTKKIRGETKALRTPAERDE